MAPAKNLPVLTAHRILAAERRGSSLPVIVETDAGTWLVKLRGAAHGTASLVAEIIVAELAESLGLPVPRRALVSLNRGTPTLDKNDELADLLRASHGLNLGFELLTGVRPYRRDDLERFDPDLASRIVWLDRLVMNPDRTAKNPNILLDTKRFWLIDHGASLPFQHSWESVTEQTPREERFATAHVLASRATRIEAWDERLAAALPREAVERATDRVPNDFLHPLTPEPARRRAAYAAFLWKRLKGPRTFVSARDHVAAR